MQYPIWDVPLLGGGMVIALIAIFHVTLAQFAVGAGFFVAISEYRAIKYDIPVFLRFLKDFSLYLILVAFILGALSGVGIWFSIAVVSPEATSALIHQYVWGWAAEYVFFLLEIVAGYIYFYTWDRITPKQHLIVGIIYAVSAFMSLVIINGIISFMLSPGEWTVTRNFWDGFLNPTYLPSTIMRTIVSLATAGIFVCIAVNYAKGYSREERHEIITEAGKYLIPLALMIPVSIWYFALVPQEARNLVTGQAIAMTLFFMFGLAASTLIGFYAFFGLFLNKRYINLETAILLGLIAFIATGSMEFVREGIRKPYIIYNYMYSNGIMLDEVDELQKTGVLDWAPWTAVALGHDSIRELPPELRGKAIYRTQCIRCHTYDGVNGIKPLIRNWPRDSIRQTLETLHIEQYYMPPFVGPEQDLVALTEYLYELGQKQKAETPPITEHDKDEEQSS
ncbi:MAG: cytochrome ubiquinol oxidase subunit I [bacterium]|jgi:cytochrome d ubiquinol oxidase subunit I